MQYVQLLESLAVIVASVFAIFGINSWRREMKGRKEYEVAEEVLSLFYEAKDKISAIRSPLKMKGEGEGREADPRETPEQKEAFNQAYVVFQRYQKHQNTFNKLRSLRYRFMALFGKEKIKPFDELNKILNQIFSAANLLSHYWSRSGDHIFRNEKELDNLEKSIHKYEGIFWDSFADSDPINFELAKAITDIEKTCEPILRRNVSKTSKISKKK